MLYYYNWFVYFKHLAHTHMCSMRWAVNYFILFVYTEEKKIFGRKWKDANECKQARFRTFNIIYFRLHFELGSFVECVDCSPQFPFTF